MDILTELTMSGVLASVLSALESKRARSAMIGEPSIAIGSHAAKTSAITERWQRMSPDERRALRERWRGMTPEERRDALQRQLRDRTPPP
jgi:hypothetical protein